MLAPSRGRREGVLGEVRVVIFPPLLMLFDQLISSWARLLPVNFQAVELSLVSLYWTKIDKNRSSLWPTPCTWKQPKDFLIICGHHHNYLDTTGCFFFKNHLWTMPSMSKGRVERRRMRNRRRTTWPILISCWRSTTSGPLLESLSNFGPLQKKHVHIASNIKKPKAVISHQGSSGGGLEALVKFAQQTIVDFQQVPLHLIYEKISELKLPWERLLTNWPCILEFSISAIVSLDRPLFLLNLRPLTGPTPRCWRAPPVSESCRKPASSLDKGGRYGLF